MSKERYGHDHRRARNAATAINDAADWLSRQFSGEPRAEPAPANEPELKLDVRAVLADMSRKGHTAEIRDLLRSTVPPSFPALIQRTTTL